MILCTGTFSLDVLVLYVFITVYIDLFLNLYFMSCFMLISCLYDCPLKGVLCGFGEEIQTQNFNSYNKNEVIIQTQKYCFFFHS